jgi:hypothetical protein
MEKDHEAENGVGVVAVSRVGTHRVRIAHRRLSNPQSHLEGSPSNTNRCCVDDYILRVRECTLGSRLP